MNKLTRAQLIERINVLEAEVNTFHVEQRPSRPTRHTITPQQRVQRIAAYFAANPGARSVTPAQLAAF